MIKAAGYQHTLVVFGAIFAVIGVIGAVMLKPGDQIGDCQISCKADADMGEGVRELVTLLDVTVVGGEAVAGTITPVGEAKAKP